MKTRNAWNGDNFKFASTGTLFGMPHGLTDEQQGLFTILTAAINEKCFEDLDWDGNTIFLELETECPIPKVKEVLEIVDRMCQLENMSLYSSYLFDGKWAVGVIGGVEVPIVRQPEVSFDIPIHHPVAIAA